MTAICSQRGELTLYFILYNLLFVLCMPGDNDLLSAGRTDFGHSALRGWAVFDNNLARHASLPRLAAVHGISDEDGIQSTKYKV